MARPTKLKIDKEALLHNVARVRAYAPKSALMAMVKANAYGHGLECVAQVIHPFVDFLGVACIEEAYRLRACHIKTPIVLMEGVFDVSEIADVLHYDLELVIHDPAQLRFLMKPLSKKIKVWIKLDTGMHRLGFPLKDFDEVYRQLQACDWIESPPRVMTHFACADLLDNPLTPIQMARFRAAIQAYPQSQCSLANSAAIIGWQDSHEAVVRPGIMLYGISPFEGKLSTDFGLRPVMHFSSQLVAIQTYEKGECIGYGQTFCCSQTTRIGVVAAGYGDGYPRHVGSGTSVQIRGTRVPLVGRVSMDLLTVDLSSLCDALVGDPVELWGPTLPIEEIARAANTIPYELVCQVAERVR